MWWRIFLQDEVLSEFAGILTMVIADVILCSIPFSICLTSVKSCFYIHNFFQHFDTFVWALGIL